MTITQPTTTWHRPWLWLGAVMAVVTFICIGGLIVDDRTLLGVNVWEKPLKFSISTVIYAITWSWLIGQVVRFRRIAWWAGTVTAALWTIELVIIVGDAIGGAQSHFNVTTPYTATLWSIMGTSISILWVVTFVLCVILFRNSLGDAARTLAIRSGALLALVGMGLGFLMTIPTSAQLSDFRGISGAHTVGLEDGGPGIPILGWSTVGGDLRIPHFVGMHALQLLPLLIILIELAARRVPLLREVSVRYRIVLVAAASYVGVIGIVTWQALRGQSIVHPDAVTLAVAGALLIAASAGLAVVLARRDRTSGLADPQEALLAER
jgi:hypothetical protein